MRIKQHYKYDCGAACLSCICSYYGAHYTLAELSLYCGGNKDGISIKGLIDGAAKVGLEAKGYKSPDKEISALSDISTPIIAHTKNEDGYFHFIVVVAITDKHIKIMDPSFGAYKKLSYKEFSSIWSGYIIVATPTQDFVKREKHSTVASKMYSLFILYKKECLLSFLGAAACIAIGICTSVFLQTFVDKALEDSTHFYIKLMSVLVVALSVLSLYISYCATVYLIRCSIKIDATLVTNFLEKLFVLPLQFFRSHPIGDITARMDDIVKIRSFITNGIISALTAFLTLFGACILMFVFNTKLAFAIICFIPVYTGLYFLSRKINKRLGKKLSICSAEFEANILENLNGITTVKHYNCHSITLNKLGKHYIKYAEAYYRSANAINKFETSSSAISICILATVFVLGTASIITKELTVGEFVGFYTLCSFFTAPLNRLMGMGEVISNATVAFERLQEILELKDEREENTNDLFHSLPFDIKECSIDFCNVEFCYPGRETLLSNLNFSIKAGEITAILGKNGCGKTTIASLITKDCVPTNGKIMASGVNLSLLSIELWREQIAYIEQSSQLFNTSILENITCSEDNKDIEKVLHICNRVGLLELVQSLPMGLLTVVGNNGKILSGGECNKICIARALYKNPQIYIFDEPTSHLDEESCRKIQKLIIELRKEKKHIILISHNYEDVKLANNIIRVKGICSSGNLPCTNSAG